MVTWFDKDRAFSTFYFLYSYPDAVIAMVFMLQRRYGDHFAWDFVCNRGDHPADNLSDKLGLLLVVQSMLLLGKCVQALSIHNSIDGCPSCFQYGTPRPGDRTRMDLGFHEFMPGNLRNDTCKQSWLELVVYLAAVKMYLKKVPIISPLSFFNPHACYH